MSDQNIGNFARRNVLAVAGALVVAGPLLGVGCRAEAAPVDASISGVKLGRHSLSLIDLTHRLTREFNFDPARPRIAMESVDGSGVAVGMKMHRLALIEHTGTHIDAPSHFGAALKSLGELPASDLVVPLAVLDITGKALRDRNAQVEPADIELWERRHGRLPNGCCVAMNSGWDPLVETPLNQREGKFASPGFSPVAGLNIPTARSVYDIVGRYFTVGIKTKF